MDMATPSPGHELMKRLAGTWEGPETMHPSPWDPEGSTAFGRNRNSLQLRGFALITDYEQLRNEEVGFVGHGVLTFDAEVDLYTLHWFDSMGSPPEVFTGAFAGDGMILEHGGPGMHARLTWDLSEPNLMRCSMDMREDVADWKRLFDADYRRTE